MSLFSPTTGLRRTALALASVCLVGSASVQATEYSKIQNGVAAASGAYPWLVSISRAAESDPVSAHFCGGSLLSDRWVLTAAHCFKDGSATVAADQAVVVGRDKLSDTTAGQRIIASRVIIHPAYNPTTIDNDIALVELSTPVTVASASVVKFAVPANTFAVGTVARAAGHGLQAPALDYVTDSLKLTASCSKDIGACTTEAYSKGYTAKDIVRAMLLANGLKDPTLGLGYNELVALAVSKGVAATASMGFDALFAALQQSGAQLSDVVAVILKASGVSDETRQVDMPLVSDATCAAANSGLTNNMFCAGYTDQPKDTCQGDSGGPLVVRNGQNSDWLQLGIVSFGQTCGTAVGVYVKLVNYLDWIGQYVPHFNEERLFTWAESAAGNILKPAGNERSVSASPYWARCYSASGTCIGTDGTNAAYYDGKAINNLGAEAGWIQQAVKAGY